MKVEHKVDHLLANYSEMANLLRCTERHLANLVSLGLVPSIRMGKAVRFDPADVIAALKAQAQGGEAKAGATSTCNTPSTCSPADSGAAETTRTPSGPNPD